MINLRPKGPAGFEPRSEAARVLALVSADKADADDAAGRTLDTHPGADPRDRALFYELVLGTLRMRGAIDCAIEKASSRPTEKIDPRVMEVLRVAAYQFMFLERIPTYAAVCAAVTSARTLRLGEGAARFVNAVLRKISASPASPPGSEELLSHPPWILERFKKILGEQGAAELCLADNQPPPLTIRSVVSMQDRSDLAGILDREGIQSTPCAFAPQGLRLATGTIPSASPSFMAGMWTVQDEASQIVSPLLDPRPGEKILDACAAPGGKTAHIADLMGGKGEIRAVEREPARIPLILDTLRRLHVTAASVHSADSSAALPFPDGYFDRVLVDAPCSALGTLRRSPEIKWRLDPSDPGRLAVVQSSLLSSVSHQLKSGGVLVYSVCTLTEEEGPLVVRGFLERHGEFALAPPPKGLKLPDSMLSEGFIRTWPHLHGTDGFFIAKMIKK